MKDLNNKKEYLFQYKVEEFKVIEKSVNKIWPPYGNKDKEKWDTDEDLSLKNRKKIKIFFYYYIGFIWWNYFFTFISFFIYFTLNKNPEDDESDNAIN